MAETLKSRYGVDVPHRVAAMVAAVHPAFDTPAFVDDALAGYDTLELMPRGRHMAQALRRHLPADVPTALDLLVRSLPPVGTPVEGAMGPFVYLPHSFYIAEHGLDHFEAAMRAMHALTQRFTAEFCVRPFLLQHQQATLACLQRWASDPSEHVRRLVSEGTRPRLPWAPRLPAFQRDPTTTLALLEGLKDDPSLYVRRSVANHLNDIGKDHPDRLVATTQRWMGNATPQRRWVVHHALRSLVKQGHPNALATIGFGEAAQVRLDGVVVDPPVVPIGAKVALVFDLTHVGKGAQRVLVDLRVHYVKQNGRTGPKVFKFKVLDLAPGQTVRLTKHLSLAQLTTRQHHPGHHRVEVLVNGLALPLGAFEVVGP
jgi:3-methyladenine DNA glycosylase AlkC